MSKGYNMKYTIEITLTFKKETSFEKIKLLIASLLSGRYDLRNFEITKLQRFYW